MLSLYFVHYNFCRIHQTLGVTPAMSAGLDSIVRDCEWIVGPDRRDNAEAEKARNRQAPTTFNQVTLLHGCGRIGSTSNPYTRDTIR